MHFRPYRISDFEKVRHIFAHYWTDPEFIQELDSALHNRSDDFYVAEIGDEIIGVIGLRALPEYFKQYSSTTSPTELYIIGAKSKRQGTGTFLLKNITSHATARGITELLCYSPTSHQASWDFYIRNGFVYIKNMLHPEDECDGAIFTKKL